MSSIETKRLFVTATLVLGFIGACGSDGPSGSGPSKTLVCESDAECEGDKPFCDPYSGCAECLLNAQCEEGSRCSDHECVVPTTCASSEDCDAENPVCNPIVDECVGCVRDDDCLDENICLEGRCTAITACVNTLDCSDGEVCDRARGYCVQCVGDGDCGEESACVENACVLRCDSDNDCRSGGLLCDAAAGHCVECVEQADCPDVYNCRSGRCVVDECLQGTSSCVSANAISACNETGSATELEYCPPDSTCSDSLGFSSCLPWECFPGTANCTGSFLEVCDSTGLLYIPTDCSADGGTCENGACVEVVCDAGARFCDAGVVYQCTESGTSYTSVEACGIGEFCDEVAAACTFQVCTPGAKACDGTQQTVCNAEGSAAEVTADCSDDDEVCLLGECEPTICTPDEKRCTEDGTAVFVCNSTGTAMVLSTTCTTSDYCAEEDGTATCRVRTCTPGAPVCDGEVATNCNDVGSGVESDGTDCSEEDNQACFGGDCLPRVCTGTRYCKLGHSYSCLENGTADSLYDSCSDTQFCNEATGSCQSDACTADAAGCVDNTPGICKPDGSGYELDNPCDTDETCVSGTCLPTICVASSYYCEGQTLYRCGSDGTTTSLDEVCDEDEYCEGGFSSCQADVCTAGEPECNGAALSTCKDDGSGPEDAGTACASGKTCEDGVCADLICTPEARFCDGDTLSWCNELGTGVDGTTVCDTDTFCDESLDPANCSLDICAAGEPACDGERFATCAANGGGYTDRGTNCASSDKVCNGTACVNAAKDTVGADVYSSTSTSYRYANRYQITSDRTLTEIEQYLSVSGTSQFTWFVYEGTTETSFTKLFESLNTSSGAAVFHSSGTIAVPLVKGRFYMIGVRVDGEATRFYDYPLTSDTFVSFGQTTGSDYETSSGSLPSSWSVSANAQNYYQTLTTKLP